MSAHIEITESGVPSYTLDQNSAYRGDGTERIGYGQREGEQGPYVNFYARSLPNGAASLDASKPVFRSVVFMRLQHPGERDCIDRQATRADADRFPAAYRRYCDGRAAEPDGVPLHVLFPHHDDIVQMLRYHKVFTVEQLAKLSDTQMQNLGMGGMEWSQKAQRYLAHLERGGGFAKLEDQLRRTQADNERQRAVNDDLSAKIQALTNQLGVFMQAQTQGMPMAAMGGMQALAQMGIAPAPVGQQQRHGFVQAAPHELGADDNVPQPGNTVVSRASDLPAPAPFAEDMVPGADGLKYHFEEEPADAQQQAAKKRK
jgi:guanyl-specific ribonuclease Sa